MMANDMIFGVDVVLPTLPDLKSDCEEELNALMKEINLEFKTRNQDLHKEVSRLQALCRAQYEEIENMKPLVCSKTLERVNKHNEELERLKEENSSLKSEISILKRKAERGTKCEYELENLKRNFRSTEEENTVLKHRLAKSDEKYGELQSHYQSLSSVVVLLRDKKFEENLQKQSTNLDSVIEHETDKYFQEETEERDQMKLKINKQIDELEKRINETLN